MREGETVNQGGILGSAHWVRVFRENAERLEPLPWGRGAELTDDERRAVADSIRTFQLGETGEGRHFLEVARRHAEAIGDPLYVEAVAGLIAEEGRHAADLGRFLDLAGVPRKRRNWTDFVFRRLRHLSGLEACVTILLIAEWLAFVSYAALREATGSALLRAICRRILREEVAHVRFQGERLAILRRRRGPLGRRLTTFATRVLFLGTTAVVWWTHRRVFRRAGWSVREVFRRATRVLERGLAECDSSRSVVGPAAATAPSP